MSGMSAGVTVVCDSNLLRALLSIGDGKSVRSRTSMQ